MAGLGDDRARDRRPHARSASSRSSAPRPGPGAEHPHVRARPRRGSDRVRRPRPARAVYGRRRAGEGASGGPWRGRDPGRGGVAGRQRRPRRATGRSGRLEGLRSRKGTESYAGSFTVRMPARPASKRSVCGPHRTRRRGKYRVVKRFTVPALDHAESLKVKVSVKVPQEACPPACCRCGCARTAAEPSGSVRRTTTAVASAGSGSAHAAGRRGPPIRSLRRGHRLHARQPGEQLLDLRPGLLRREHTTPITLFVWMHGCGGQGAGDIYTVAPGGDQSYIAIALGGREGACWDLNTDTAKVLAAIANVKTHFNINPRRVILGGYSSGGDLAYRTAFYNANSSRACSRRTRRRSATPAPPRRRRSPRRPGSSTSSTSRTPRTTVSDRRRSRRDRRPEGRRVPDHADRAARHPLRRRHGRHRHGLRPAHDLAAAHQRRLARAVGPS